MLRTKVLILTLPKPKAGLEFEHCGPEAGVATVSWGRKHLWCAKALNKPATQWHSGASPVFTKGVLHGIVGIVTG